jgi:hypothetical protein
MAVMFFQGTLGGFSRYSVFSGGAQRPGRRGSGLGLGWRVVASYRCHGRAKDFGCRCRGLQRPDVIKPARTTA